MYFHYVDRNISVFGSLKDIPYVFTPVSIIYKSLCACTLRGLMQMCLDPGNITFINSRIRCIHECITLNMISVKHRLFTQHENPLVFRFNIHFIKPVFSIT